MLWFDSQLEHALSPFADLLDKFTCEEALDGQIYRCERCSQLFTYQKANKRLLIDHCPDVRLIELISNFGTGSSYMQIVVCKKFRRQHSKFPALLLLGIVSSFEAFSLVWPSEA